MATTLTELIDWLATLDEISLMELLDVSSEDLVERFEDKIEANFTYLESEKEKMD